MISKGLPALKAYEELEPESPPDTNYFFFISRAISQETYLPLNLSTTRKNEEKRRDKSKTKQQ